MTHGAPSSAFAEICSKIGATSSYASFCPPGMIEGPFKAPSSPPETPVPIKLMPELANSSLRRIVSLKNVFPPSIKISPLSR